MRERRTMASQSNRHDWLKIQPKYSPKVLIGNWLEERELLAKDFRITGDSSIYSTDFTWFSGLKPEQALKGILLEKSEGLPVQHLFSHHNEPKSWNLVSEYEDKYNRRCNPLLPPLRTWDGRRLAWVPERADFPILEPPTNYGLFEYLLRKMHEKEEVMRSVYTISYQRPPISAFPACQARQQAKIYDLPYNQRHLQNIGQIIDYEGAQKYLHAIGQLVRSRKAREAPV